MVEKVNPSRTRTADSFKTAGSIAYGGSPDGFVIDGATPTPISVEDSDITEGNFNTFSESSSGSSLDVTIDAGEGFVFGAWVAIDTSTTVTLASSTNGQTVYVGWSNDSADDVIVGLDAAFGANDQRIPLWTFDTDGSGVTSTTDGRQIGQPINSSFDNGITIGSNDEATLNYDSGSDSLAVSGVSLSADGVTIFDEGNASIPTGSLEADAVAVTAGNALTSGGSVSLGGSVTIDHADTSSQSDVTTGDSTSTVTGVTLDEYGHVSGLTTSDLSTEFVAEAGDTMSGTLTANGSYAIDARGGNRIGIPTTSSDPSANIGDMWYREDLD